MLEEIIRSVTTPRPPPASPPDYVIATPHGRRYYGTSTQILAERDKELDTVLQDMADYVGRSRIAPYLRSKGRDMVEITGVAVAPIDDRAVAAIQRNDTHGILIANTGFVDRVVAFAYRHGLTYDQAGEFIWDHERGHAAKVNTEQGVFRTQLDYYMFRVETAQNAPERERYMRLAEVAHERYALETYAQTRRTPRQTTLAASARSRQAAQSSHPRAHASSRTRRASAGRGSASIRA